MATDYMMLTEFFLEELPEEHPWRGNIKGLVEKMIRYGVTLKRDPRYPTTNADKIRAMRDVDLAYFLAGKFTDFHTQLKLEQGIVRTATDISAEAHQWHAVWMQWLRTQVENTDNG